MEYENWTKEKLIGKIFDLESAVQSLKRINDLDKTALLASAFGLSPLEARVVAVLSSGRIVTQRGLVEAIYFDRSQPDDDRIITSFISKVRAKLLPYGVNIETIHGTGRRMHNASIVQAAMSGDRVSAVVDAELPAPVARQKWKTILSEIKRIADRRGIAEFKTSHMIDVSGLAGGLKPVIMVFEREGVLKIIQRPTRKDPKRHWKVALKGRGANV